MMSFERAVLIASPVDVIVFSIEDQEIVQKENIHGYSPGSALLKKAEAFITSGDNPEKNPTYWSVSGGEKLEKIADWREKLSKVLSDSESVRVNWTDLDNNSRVATVTSEVSLLVANCLALQPKLIKEIKCATLFTAFGKIELAF